MRLVRVSLVLTLTWLVTGVAGAQTATQGRVSRDGAVIWRIESAVPLMTVQSGETLEVVAQSTRWYEVRVPQRLGGRGQTGLIAKTQLELLPGTTPPPTRALRGDPAPAQTASRPPQARPQPRRFPSTLFAFNAVYQASPTDFAETVTFDLYAEQGSFTTRFSPEPRTGFSAGMAGMAARRISVGAEVEFFTHAVPATLTASVPHPFFFATLRTAPFALPDLDQTQVAIHGQVRGVWQLTPALQISAGGGPSLFHLRQTVITEALYSESYPYDQVTVTRVNTDVSRKSYIGFNVAGDIAYFVTRHVGVGVSGGYSRADITLPVENGTLDVRAGGPTIAAGLRLRY
jgi:hypothetical protein